MEAALTLARLRVFRAVVDEGSVTSAARKLHVTQPAVSAQLRELERGLDIALVERAGRRIVPTEAGRTLAEFAARLLDLEDEAERALARVRGLEWGSLAVGASETPGHYLLLEALGAFQRAHPAIALRIDVASSAQISRRVVDGTLELGFVEALVDDPVLLRRRYVDDELVLIAAPDDPIVAKKRASPADIAERAIVSRESGSGVRTAVDDALRRAGLAPRIALELGTTEAVKRAVAAGLGLGFVPQASVAIELRAGTLAVVPMTGLEMRRRLWLIRSQRHVLSPAAEAFLALLGRERGSAA